METMELKKDGFSEFVKGQRIEITYTECGTPGTITETGIIRYTTKAYIEIQKDGSPGNHVIGRDKIIGINLIQDKKKRANKSDEFDQILFYYRMKPDIPYKHIETNYKDHKINFIYKTIKNYGNPSHPVKHKRILYIDTKKATEDDLIKLRGD